MMRIWCRSARDAENVHRALVYSDRYVWSPGNNLLLAEVTDAELQDLARCLAVGSWHSAPASFGPGVIGVLR